MKIISWNVNSIRVRLDQVLQLLEEEKPDILCLQETKVIDDQFPIKEFKKKKYFSYFSGIPSYNGVAIISRLAAKESLTLNFCEKNDARYISIKLGDLEIICIYVPAGGDEPDSDINPKFKHKLLFLEEFSKILKKKKDEKVVLCGDLNIAPYEDDVWSHRQLLNVVSHTEVERDKLKKILYDSNFTDSLRFFLNPPENVFTWWSYRSPNFEKNNRGRRLDHIWSSKILKKNLLNASILKKFRNKNKPSDHVPISLEIKE